MFDNIAIRNVSPRGIRLEFHAPKSKIISRLKNHEMTKGLVVELSQHNRIFFDDECSMSSNNLNTVRIMIDGLFD